jgi:ADP-ribosylglycohydrolase
VTTSPDPYGAEWHNDPAWHRVLGCLLGGATGDAVGTTNEFATLRGLPDYPVLVSGPQTDLLGGGPFRLAPGEVTDDTQMAAALATSLHERGLFDPGDALARYRHWSRFAFDIGGQTAAALSPEPVEGDPFAGARSAWVARSRNAAGNGALMRCWPLAVRYRDESEALLLAALSDAALTHYDPRCLLASAAMVAAVAAMLRGEGTGAAAPAAREALHRGAERLADLFGHRPEEIAAAVEALKEDLRAARSPNPGVHGPNLDMVRDQGFVRVAFRLAFWHLHHAPNYRAAMLDLANRGGDADTNACIAGALIGARDGIDAIPKSWLVAVINAEMRNHPEELRALYHPGKLTSFALKHWRGANGSSPVPAT